MRDSRLGIHVTETIVIPFRFRGRRVQATAATWRGPSPSGSNADRTAGGQRHRGHPAGADPARHGDGDRAHGSGPPADDAGETLIAEAERTTLALDAPQPPTYAAALAVRSESPSFYLRVNPLIPDGTGYHPVCACCGADVPADQACTSTPHRFRDSTAWRRPGGPTLRSPAPTGCFRSRSSGRARLPGPVCLHGCRHPHGLLGRMVARTLKPVPAGADLVVIGWRLEIEARSTSPARRCSTRTASCAPSRGRPGSGEWTEFENIRHASARSSTGSSRPDPGEAQVAAFFRGLQRTAARRSPVILADRFRGLARADAGAADRRGVVYLLLGNREEALVLLAFACLSSGSPWYRRRGPNGCWRRCGI